ncbi:hypothetical protein ACQZV8_00125 [Magnetococcales bacterium HHB-1]
MGSDTEKQEKRQKIIVLIILASVIILPIIIMNFDTDSGVFSGLIEGGAIGKSVNASEGSEGGGEDKKQKKKGDLAEVSLSAAEKEKQAEKMRQIKKNKVASSGGSTRGKAGSDSDVEQSKRPIEVTDLTVRTNRDGKKVLSGNLVNRTKQTLASVIIDISFHDVHRHKVGQKKVDPLVISGGIFGDKRRFLSGGKIHPFTIVPNNIKPKWHDGYVRAQVTHARFAKPVPRE